MDGEGIEDNSVSDNTTITQVKNENGETQIDTENTVTPVSASKEWPPRIYNVSRWPIKLVFYLI